MARLEMASLEVPKAVRLAQRVARTLRTQVAYLQVTSCNEDAGPGSLRRVGSLADLSHKALGLDAELAHGDQLGIAH
jgi:hypothetical protein